MIETTAAHEHSTCDDGSKMSAAWGPKIIIAFEAPLFRVFINDRLLLASVMNERTKKFAC